jgi:urease accessory protein
MNKSRNRCLLQGNYGFNFKFIQTTYNTGSLRWQNASKKEQKMALMKMAGVLMLLQGALLAHTGAGMTSGFGTGFFHPVGGADHVLAMVAVGLWAVQMGGRALWIVPSAFVVMMLLGGILGISGVEVPFIETGILASVVILGALIAAGAKPSVALSAAIVGLFAIFHGHAHGAEMPLDAGALFYSIGFVLATAMLHVAGIAAGRALESTYTARVARFGGGAIASAGVFLALA